MYGTGKLARGLQIAHAVESLWTVVLPLLLFLGGVMSGIEALLLGLGLYLALRVIATTKNYVVSWMHRSPVKPEHQLGLLGNLRLWWGEFWITVVTYTLLFTTESRVPQAPAVAVPGKGLPIVLVPGFACNRGYWRFYLRFLRKLGVGPVFTVSLEPLFGSIDANAALLGQQVEAVCKATGRPKVILIGHSMGGLTIRSYLHRGGAARVVKAITLGTPHHGTLIAADVKALGEDLRQMCPDSAWGEAMTALEAQPCPVPITSIVTPHDNIVYPQASAWLRYPNAKNVVIPGVAHLEMIASRPVMQAVAAELRGL